MIKKIKDNIWQFYFKAFGSCVYILKIENKIIMIDASTRENQNEFLSNLKELKINPLDVKIILLTHSHFDHIGNISLFPNAKIYFKRNLQEPAPEIKEIKIIHTPGHSSDSVCFLYEDVLFSGDTIFHNGIGRTDLPTSSPEDMQKSLEKLKKINYNVLCPGHLV